MNEKQHSLQQRLRNYKLLHEKTAKSKGCEEEFLAAKTLTKAKKILFGEKKKDMSGWRGHSDQGAIRASKNAPGGRNF